MPKPSTVAQSNGYSATVELMVHADGRTLRPTHVSDTELIFSSPPGLHAGPADVEVVVDGLSSTRAIQILPHPIEATRLTISASRLSRIGENAST